VTELAIIFASTFITVFALGFQSQNVNQGHYLWAFITSFVIGASSLVLYKKLPDAGALQCAAYLAGGAFGIVASIWVHRRTVGRKSPRKIAQADWGDEFDHLSPREMETLDRYAKHYRNHRRSSQ